MSKQVEKEFNAVRDDFQSLRSNKAYVVDYQAMGQEDRLSECVGGLEELCTNLKYPCKNVETVVRFLGGAESVLLLMRQIYGLDRDTILKAACARLLRKRPALRRGAARRAGAALRAATK